MRYPVSYTHLFDEANMTYTATPAAENADPSTTYNYTNMQYSSSGSSSRSSGIGHIRFVKAIHDTV